MKEIHIQDILNVTKGELIVGNTNEICQNFSKDTRTINKGDTYIGIKGENFNGSLFWKGALQKGADCVIVQDIDFSNENIEEFKNKNIIKVKDTIQALGEIARYKRDLYGSNFPLVGVTGSVGKTSTKDMIASVLSQKYKTLKTQGNNNNNIGLPLTILNLKDHQAAVIEMGMNHLREIAQLTRIAKPTLSVITNIGTSHIGNLGSRENILLAKLEILEGMEKPLLVINNDNDLLHQYYEQNKINIKTFGIENISDVYAENIDLKENESIFTCNLLQEKFEVKVPVGGIHFVYNALCAAYVGNLFGLKIEEIKRGIEQFELTKKRMDIIETKNGVKVINDTYNASFESMRASLQYLSNLKNNRKIAVLGDMFELGEYSEELHKKVGAEVVNNSIDILICNGKNAKNIADEAIRRGMKKTNVYYLENKEDIINLLENIIKRDDVILFKASNGMKFFNLVEQWLSRVNS